MPLEPVNRMLTRCMREKYAVGYFESWNLESLQGVLDAAEQTRSPIIVGFSGEFLSGDGRTAQERLAIYGAMGRAAAESAKVPVAFIFNECSKDDWVEQAIYSGFNLVMPADPAAAPADYERRVTRLVEIAHAQNIAVEAELGELPCGVGGTLHGGGATRTADATGFVARTHVDLLAVSIGNVHMLTTGRAGLDLDHLAELRRAVSVPLVLHGGTGIADDDLKAAIRIGISKVNYGTYIKQRYLPKLRDALANDSTNPHVVLGMGGETDLMVIGRFAVRDAVLERIELLGCCGKADR